MHKKKNISCVVMGFTGLLGACAQGPGTIQSRYDEAAKIAASGSLVRRDIPAEPFILASWQKITAPGPIHIYIEGDGLAWLSRSTPSGNPTPKDPQALRLAAADPAPNVVYLARPCQFTEIGTAENRCPRDYWMGKRYAPEVIAAYDQLLSQWSDAHKKPRFHLIGFSGGANIAGLLAQRRSDVLSLRTVAGNLDNDAFNTLHGVSPMPLSLNMAKDASRLARIPQRHFVGGKDEFVPQPIFESYKRALGPTPCLSVTISPEAEHLKGWTEQWNEYLTLPLTCEN